MNEEKYGVLDVGSNSVRALVYSDGKTLYSGLITSRLGEGLGISGKLSAVAMIRTVNAIEELSAKCVIAGADKVFAFATEAVRSAENGDEFVSLVKERTGLDVEVISGDEEGELGLLGALSGKDGGIIDIGGASTEITVAKGGKIVYSHSMPLGAVRLTDLCGEDEKALYEKVSVGVSGYGELPCGVDYYFIGGTSSAVCMVAKNMKKFRSEFVDETVLTYDDIAESYSKIKNATLSERVNDLHIDPKRAQIIVGGAYLIKFLFERFGFEKVTVKVNDNMLGYLRKKVFGEGYEKK